MGYLDKQGLERFWGKVTSYVEEKAIPGPAGPDGNPIGTVISFMGTSVPNGYLACDGAVYTIEDYPELAQHIETQFGSVSHFGGDGEITFAVPDMAGRFALNTSDTYQVGDTGGEENHMLTKAEMPSHSHQEYVNYKGAPYPFGCDNGSAPSSNSAYVNSSAMTTKSLPGFYSGNTGSSNPHNNMPPYMTVLYCIKAVESKPSEESSGGVPSGSIIIWSGAADAIPDGWALCDGENGTPDLRGRFVLGAGGTYAVGATGGEATHTLTTQEMPSHKHGLSATRGVEQQTVYNNVCVNMFEYAYNQAETKTSGGGQAHNNMPPYYVLCYIMKL